MIARGETPGRWTIAQGETLGVRETPGRWMIGRNPWAGGNPHLFVEPFPFDYIKPPLLLAPNLPDRECVVGANDYSPETHPGLGHFRKSCPRRTPDWVTFGKSNPRRTPDWVTFAKATRDAPRIGHFWKK